MCSQYGQRALPRKIHHVVPLHDTHEVHCVVTWSLYSRPQMHTTPCLDAHSLAQFSLKAGFIRAQTD